jgi:leucyl-tRNA---protein transferase
MIIQFLRSRIYLILEGYQLEKTETKCPYLENRVFTSNNMIIKSIDEEGLAALLEAGYRHFGEYYFRPECIDCGECRPIRIPVASYGFSKSEKRVLKKTSGFRVLLIDNPVPNSDKFELYTDHKRRFGYAESETYENWKKSFFSGQVFNRIMEIWDGDLLVAVTHMDVTAKLMSAVYCYWHESYASFSPGKLSILLGLQTAIKSRVVYYYLGYYIKDNKHMSYKCNYKPNEILYDGEWNYNENDNNQED